jgi:hypothetical protein
MVTVQWLDAARKTQPLLAKPGSYMRPRLAPDGQRLALNPAPRGTFSPSLLSAHRERLPISLACDLGQAEIGATGP